MSTSAVSAPATSAAQFLPSTKASLAELRPRAAGCRGCPLYRRATQTVFGAGPAKARIMLVGEQPGDQEDRQGKPFVGPAGRLLDEALGAAGIDRR
ncbi:MAG TPA: uracil-DNA glycosylase family protein, partial [Candidatus Didemnitutus sp.]|nr:uracil-DNA glycosylase family protein [Candidatus Didemnitutus sp.]